MSDVAWQATEYRVVYDVEFVCNCPDCPVRTHTESGRVFDRVTAPHVDQAVTRAYGHRVPHGKVVNVRVEERSVSGWSLSTGW